MYLGLESLGVKTGSFKQDILKKIPNAEYSNQPASPDTVQAAQAKLGCKFGKQLRDYLIEFGYLAFGSVELYGITERQKLNSDLVKTTLMLHKQWPVTSDKTAIENQGDATYILVDGSDKVYEFIPDENSKKCSPLKMSLLQYIISRAND